MIRDIHQELKEYTDEIKKSLSDDFISITKQETINIDDIRHQLIPIIHGLQRIDHIKSTLALYKEDLLRNVKECVKGVIDNCLDLIEKETSKIYFH